MKTEQIRVAGLQIAQVEGNRQADWAGLDNGRSVFCPPFVDGRSRTIETLDDSPGVLSGVVDLRYLQQVREKYPYRSDRSEFY